MAASRGVVRVKGLVRAAAYFSSVELERAWLLV